MNYSSIIEENRKRVAELNRINNNYNPLTGEASTSISRTHVYIEDAPIKDLWLPDSMLDDPMIKPIIEFRSITKFIKIGLEQPYTAQDHIAIWEEFCRIRYNYDFEFWAIMNVLIEPKQGGEDIPFFLNRAQRKLLKKLEEMRLAGIPIRIILLKARQWGGSTLVQIYMSWIQLIHRTNWHSVICAHVESTSRVIKGMYSKMLKGYPANLVGSSKLLKLSPYEGSHKTSIIKERDCRITIGSAEKPDGVRGEHISMAHISEYGLWKKTDGKTPEDTMQSITGGILDAPDTMIVIESTAKGVGNSFHRDWKLAETGKSNYVPIFIAWFDIDIYSANIANYKEFIQKMEEYDWMLWNLGCTLEGIAWYKEKSRGFSEDWRMKSEYPSTPIEAFQSTGKRKFDLGLVQRLYKTCTDPIWIGDIYGEKTTGKDSIKNITLVQEEKGALKIWRKPDYTENIARRYCISVDIGGKSDKSDWSVITVFDRYYMMEPGGVPEVAAQWRGHIDHDILAWKAVQLAILYNKALLVIESNTLDTEGTEGAHGEFILDEIAKEYTNLYCRNSAEVIRDKVPPKWGFHMNVQTKTLIMDHHVKILRENGYIERDIEACYEHDTYEIKDNGSLGAVEGEHDDILITRATGVYVCYDFKRFALPCIIAMEIMKRTTNAQRGAADF